MKLDIDESITLREYQYRITERLGHGAVADVYLATLIPQDPRTASEQVILKVVRDETSLDEQRVAGIRREGKVLEILNQAEDEQWPPVEDGPVKRLQRAKMVAAERHVIALLDSGEIDGQPYLVQEQAPPAFDRIPVNTLADERRMLEVAKAIADVLVLAHRHNFTLKDFEPQTKWDRIRLRWDTHQQRFDLKIIDWNITGGPEDIAQDLFFFGGHLHYFLLGDQVALDKDDRPPPNLDLGTAGWKQITEGSRQLLRQLLHRDPSRRYASAADVARDIAWWLDILYVLDQPNPEERFLEHLWQARTLGQHNRVLAVADLAIRLELSAQVRENIEQLVKQAREELEKEDWLLLAQARVILVTGNYTKAAEEFRRLLRDQNLPPEAARKARLYGKLSLVGETLKRMTGQSDIRTSDTWAVVTRGVEELSRQEWEKAQDAFREAAHLQPGLESWEPMKELRGLAEAGLLVNEANQLIEEAQPRRADATRPDWLQIERQKVSHLEAAVNQLSMAAQTQEPDILEYFQAARDRLNRRRKLLDQYEDVDKLERQAHDIHERGREAEASGRFQVAHETYTRASGLFVLAIDEIRQILEHDPAGYRAVLVSEHLQAQYEEVRKRAQMAADLARQARKVDELLNNAEEAIQQHQYSQALACLQQIEQLAPGRSDTRRLSDSIIAGLLSLARDAVRQNNYMVGRDYIDQIEKIDPDRSDTKFLHERINKGIQDTLRTARLALQHGDYRAGVAFADQIAFAQSPEAQELREEANLGLAIVDEAEQTLAKAARFLKEQRLRDARQSIQTVVGFQDQPLRALAHTTPISERVGERRFQLSEDLKVYIQTLERQSLDLIHHRLEQIQHLTDPLRVFSDLSRMLEVLSVDPPEQTAQFRDLAGSIWIKQIKKLDLKQAEHRIDEGLQVFRDTQHVQALANMQARIGELDAIVQEIDRLVGTDADSLASTAGDRPERLRSRLSDLYDRSTQLGQAAQTGEWLNLANEVKRQHGRLKRIIDAYLASRYEQARSAIQGYQLQTARQIAQAAWEPLPEEIRSQIRSGSGNIELEALIAGLDRRQELEAKVRSMIIGFARASLPFAYLANELRNLPRELPGKVPVDHLIELHTTVEKAANIEELIVVQPDISSFAAHIHQLTVKEQELLALWTATSITLQTNALPELESLLQPRFELLQQSLHGTSYQTAIELCWKFDVKAYDLTIATSDSRDQEFLLVFWQACWWQAWQAQRDTVTTTKAVFAREHLERARAYFQEALNKTQQMIHASLSLPPKAVVDRHLLFQGLRVRPEAIHLPALPNGQLLSTRPSALDKDTEDALNDLLAMRLPTSDVAVSALEPHAGETSSEPGVNAELAENALEYRTLPVPQVSANPYETLDLPIVENLLPASASDTLATEPSTADQNVSSGEVQQGQVIEKRPTEDMGMLHPAFTPGTLSGSSTSVDQKQAVPNLPDKGAENQKTTQLPTTLPQRPQEPITTGFGQRVRMFLRTLTPAGFGRRNIGRTADSRTSALVIGLLLVAMMGVSAANLLLQRSPDDTPPAVNYEATIQAIQSRAPDGQRTITAQNEQISQLTLALQEATKPTKTPTATATPEATPTPTEIPPLPAPGTGIIISDQTAAYADPTETEPKSETPRIAIDTPIILCAKLGQRYLVAAPESNCTTTLGWVTAGRINITADVPPERVLTIPALPGG